MTRYILSLIGLMMALGLQAQAPRRVMTEDLDQEHRAIRMVPSPERTAAAVGVRKIIPRIPVLMVEFSDFSFSRTKEQVDSLFNGEDYCEEYPHATAVGSVRRYFEDQSTGLYSPQFDIYGPIRIDRSCSSNLGSTSAVRTLAREVCTAADSLVDFSIYDADQDGNIDLVYIYYAGFGSNDGDYVDTALVKNPGQLIWPHWSTTSGASFDGLNIRDYECSNELDGYWTHSLDTVYPAGIGIAVHEFCHALGLPDLYPTNGLTDKFRHLGAYDIMDYGAYSTEMFCPPSLSAYERWFLGWMTPTLLNSPQDVELGYLGTTNEACLITMDGQPLSGAHSTTAPYYLLENRQKEKWDAGTVQGRDILGHGLMITRITFDQSAWTQNAVNNDSTLQRVQLIVANGDYSLSKKSYWYGRKTDLFPAGATEYLVPDSFPITEIREEDGVIRFKFMGGSPESALPELPAQEGGARKIFRNGQIVIVRGEQEFTPQGQRIR